MTDAATAPRRPKRRRLRRVVLALAGLLVVGFGALVADGWRAFGHRAAGARKQRMEQSPQWHGGHFENPQPLRNEVRGAMTAMFGASPHASPTGPVPVAAVDPRRFDTPPPTGLRLTWLGHSAVLLEIDGHRVLTDPAFGERASPYPWVGPRRWYPPPLPVKSLPPLDAVVVSHDHYDHLDAETIAAMKDLDTTFVVPLGVAAHLAYWGVPESHIVELDWWQRAKVRGLEIVCVPARHASGRVLVDNDATLWAGWAFLGGAHRAYYSGDTGLHPGMKEIGARLGPFDVTMIEVGQYHRAWPDWHIGPEQAVLAHRLVRGKVMLPVHWGLFQLAPHGWTEPIERVTAAAARAGVTIVAPRPGQSFEPAAPPPPERWWPDLAWQNAQEHPIRSTQVDGLEEEVTR